MNPMAVVKLKPQLDKFTENHPGIPQFLHTAASGMEEDGYVQLKVTNAAGQKIEANIKLTADDIELFDSLREILSQAAGR
ncbi:hypothetical protein [uncultured Ruminococcus sp.]|uniref:hypothetical protein n=1 Tax=uncultured Ruminococcus sp. TaxID=165186 RepID=UPI0025CFC532|nr:hypothetical protein [uncultured Ruminococcus sp.]